MMPRNREVIEKRRNIRLKGGMDLRANFVTTKENPNSNAMVVKARNGSIASSSIPWVLGVI